MSDDTHGTGLRFFLEDGRVWARNVLRRADGALGERSRQALGDAEAEMAVVYDAGLGLLHRVGPPRQMEQYAERLRAVFAAAGDPRPRQGPGGENAARAEDRHVLNPRDVRLVLFRPTAESLRALTDCWHRTGSAAQFVARFGQDGGPCPAGPGG